MNYELIPPGGNTGESFPVIEGLTAQGKETVAQITNDAFGQLFADKNPIAMWCVILMRKQYGAKIRFGITYGRLPKDDYERLACLREINDSFVVGAFWMNSDGETFGYQLLAVAIEYFRDDKAKDCLLGMIEKLLEVEFGGKRTLFVDDAFE